jgi:hypothetical protein
VITHYTKPKCKSPVPLLHIGFGTFAPLLGPASAPLGHWLRYLWDTCSTSLIDVPAIFALSGQQSGRGGCHVEGVIDG